jgi:hypothetical protein
MTFLERHNHLWRSYKDRHYEPLQTLNFRRLGKRHKPIIVTI